MTLERKTIFSSDRVYRYTLWREWSDDLLSNRTKEGFVQFIGLNPSTADDILDDPTIRRCRDFTKRWGFNAMCMTNLFAFRATEPKEMKKHPIPVGVDNIQWLETITAQSAMTICAWGKGGKFNGQDKVVLSLIRSHAHKLFHLSLNGDGTPKHPLYLKQSTMPILWA